MRRSAVMVALLAAAVVASSASARTYDRTVSCPVPVQGGVNVFSLSASGPSATSHGAVSLDLPSSIGAPKQLVGAFGSRPGAAQFDPKLCAPAPAVPLARAGLPVLQVLGRGGELNDGDGDTCWSAATIVVRLRAQLDAHGSVTSAQLAIRTGKKLRPLVFVDWTSKHVAVYGTDDCMPSS